MYAVVACSACRRPWLAELRHRRVSCPGCGRRVELDHRTRLWQGSDVRAAQAAVATHRAAMAQGKDPAEAQAALAAPEPLVRHDDPLDAAAAKGRRFRNLSDRADCVALWITRLVGPAAHDTWVDALRRAGLGAQRSEKEIVRMLAGDVIYEPRAGHYAHLNA